MTDHPPAVAAALDHLVSVFEVLDSPTRNGFITSVAQTVGTHGWPQLEAIYTAAAELAQAIEDTTEGEAP